MSFVFFLIILEFPEQVVRWLLDNLSHEAAVAQLAHKLLPRWEEKGIAGTTAAKTGEALNTALDALEALPLLEPGAGGGGRKLPEVTVLIFLLSIIVTILIL